MKRIVRHLTSFVVVVTLVSVVFGGAAARAAPAGVPVSGPVLTAAAVAPGTIAVAGRAFTPGGQVYLAVFDVWGTPRFETRWISANPNAYGRDGSADGAAGFVAGGAFEQRFGRLCGDSALVRAYDQGTFAYTQWLAVDLSEFRAAVYGPDGSTDPARGYVPAC